MERVLVDPPPSYSVHIQKEVPFPVYRVGWSSRGVDGESSGGDLDIHPEVVSMTAWITMVGTGW